MASNQNDFLVCLLWSKFAQKRAPQYYSDVVTPFSQVFEDFGRRGFSKQQTRQLGQLFEAAGLLKIVPCSGWKILKLPPEELVIGEVRA